MDTCRGRLILHPLTQRCYCPRSKRSKAACVVTLACDLDLFASSIPTSLAAIFLARGCFTKTRDMRALCLLLICHLLPPLLQFSFLFLSIGELVLRHHTLHAAFQTWQLAQCKLFFTIRPVPGRKGVQGATLSR